MKNSKRSIFSSLFAVGALFALGACVEPVIIGGNGSGGNGAGGNSNGGNGNGGGGVACMADSNCAPGQKCVNGQCSGGDPTTCNGMPSPLSCTQTGCAAGQMCVPDDPNVCYPSSCGCDIMTGTWVCTADCGQGSHCVGQVQCGPNAPCPPNSMCGADGLCHAVCGGVPGMAELCNGIDDDCDGKVDEQDDPAKPLCQNGQACVMGQCAGGPVICMTDADCGANQVCTNGQCTNSSPQCGPNAPCPSGQVCSAMGTCVPGVCMPSTEVCNGKDDDCDGKVDAQDSDMSPCANGTTCVNGQCGGNVICMSNADCGANQVCTNGQCTNVSQQCGPNAPCPAGQMCSPNGVCVGGCVPGQETCNGKDDDCDGKVDEQDPGMVLCANGLACVNGQCGNNVQCSPNVPCPSGQVCTAAGVCKIPCQMGANNCPAGQACVNGFCN